MMLKRSYNHSPNFIPAAILLAAIAFVPALSARGGRGPAQRAAAFMQAGAATQSPGVRFAAYVPYNPGGANAASVAIADLNGDGKADIAVTNQGTNTVGVLLGNGDGTFQPAVTNSSGGSGPVSVAVADLNGDGHLDLIVGNQCPSSGDCTGGIVSVLLNKGDGTFWAAVNYSTGGSNYSIAVAIADLNGDGHPDVIVSNNISLGDWPNGSVSVLLGNGDGTFQPAANYRSGGYIAMSVAAQDLNGDGKLDLVVVNLGSSSVTVLLGKGDGTFQAPVAYSAGFGDPGFGYPCSVALQDVNGDGKADIVVTNGCEFSHKGKVSVLLGNGDGTFQQAATYDSGGWDATSVVIVDVNGDGYPDLVVTNFCGGSDACVVDVGGVVSVLLGNGDGTFQPPAHFPSGGMEANSVAVTDLNRDGKPDLVVANGYPIPCCWGTHPGEVSVLLNSLTITTGIALTSSPNPSFVNQPVAFTATITSTRPIPNGQVVTFRSAGVIGTGTTKSGAATFTTSSLSAGGHTITAIYTGGGFLGASSGKATQLVNGFATSTTFTSGLNPSIYGQAVVFTATVTTTASLPPTGNVAFTWGGIYTIGSATLNSSGVAILTKSNLNADPYPLTAVYKGDATNVSSTSAVLNQVVQETTSAAAITSSLNPSKAGQTVTFTAAITSPTVIPTGPVTFMAGTTVLGTAQLSGGKAKYTTSSLPTGTTAIGLTYNGDSNIAKSSASVSQVVQP